MQYCHTPVMLQACVEGLNIRADGVYLDGTVGGAGHSLAIAARLTTGRLIALDRDPDAVAVAAQRLAGLPAEVILANYRDAAAVLAQRKIPALNGALLDLGVSSSQMDNAKRGFSYLHDAPLDMRMSQTGTSAADLVNTLSQEQLSRILSLYGEEPYAERIARKIVTERVNHPITTTGQLAALVASAIPPKERRKHKNPARRSFQALRIAVNGELDALNEGLDSIFTLLAPSGRLCVITFHSLEDRIVKNKFRRWASSCTCPPEWPVCVCGGKPKAKLIAHKPIVPDEAEQAENRRSRSAKLRVLEKL